MRPQLRNVVPARVWRALKVLQTPTPPLSLEQRVDLPYSERFPDRRDITFFEIGDGITLAVFWKALDIGSGPAFSLHAGASEPLRFDCFGPGEGHFHTEIPTFDGLRVDRIWLPEPTRRAQVDRALWEIETNAAYYLARTPLLEGRGVRIDPAKLGPALREARRIACGFIDTVPELQADPGKQLLPA